MLESILIVEFVAFAAMEYLADMNGHVGGAGFSVCKTATVPMRKMLLARLFETAVVSIS